MSTGSGGTKNQRPDYSGQAASSSGMKLLESIHSGAFQKLSYAQQDKMFEAADKEASKLSENRSIYSDKEWDALKEYEGSHYDRINAAASGTAVSTVSEHTKETVRNLESALKRRKLNKDIIVWRGSMTAEEKSGRFLSTSLKPSIAQKFSQGTHIHAYRIPKGTNYIYTEAKGEFEVILPRNFDFNKHRIR